MSARCYINEFRPLAQTPVGRGAINKHNLPPFIDASCRREPDLESDFPSITALCRAEYFAPRLREGDVVAYMTKDFVYPKKSSRTRRLVAVLRIHKSWLNYRSQRGLEAHVQAAKWYHLQGLTVPSNCISDDNEPMPLDVTDRYFSDLKNWDNQYRYRAIQCGAFHACEKIFCDVNDPPRLTNKQLVDWFSRIPDTRELPPLPTAGFRKMLSWLVSQVSDTASRLRLNDLLSSTSCAIIG